MIKITRIINCKESHKKDKDDNQNNEKKVVAKIRVKIRVRRLMIRMIRIMMILRITRIIHMKKMIEITSTSTSTSTGTRTRTIINVTIAFQSQKKLCCFIVLTNSHCPQLQCQLLSLVGALQLRNDLYKQHSSKMSNHPDIHIM